MGTVVVLDGLAQRAQRLRRPYVAKNLATRSACHACRRVPALHCLRQSRTWIGFGIGTLRVVRLSCLNAHYKLTRVEFCLLSRRAGSRCEHRFGDRIKLSRHVNCQFPVVPIALQTIFLKFLKSCFLSGNDFSQ